MAARCECGERCVPVRGGESCLRCGKPVSEPRPSTEDLVEALAESAMGKRFKRDKRGPESKPES